MAKRFIDTAMWRDPWFRKLPAHIKLFWSYICSECDVAGVWKVDFEAASFFLGHKIEESSIEYLNDSKIRVQELKPGYWLISDFITFQFGELTPSCPPHRTILKLIDSHIKTINYPNCYPKLRVQEKEKEQENKGVLGGNKGRGGRKEACHVCGEMLPIGDIASHILTSHAGERIGSK